ncbi:Gfo/Idh/MocA family protein [Herbiconiux daphne]|uniref:Gfo/Idh/MocA family oxidoreductase n=1 Tax=Herbiconiux daphne TaxID=2970914 RepID=A0ABT2H532_9MICO|nr:Gfo/Idh/MocA family oxidoreductase [Herbiconiux daphne]MCS5735008.1 Gfo/Idh/MocA family oxidoreductase [Herbiconiux daphne]
MSDLRLLQVGIGSWGSSWLDVVQKSEGFTLAGIVSQHFEATTEAAERTGATAYPTIEAALEVRDEFDAVLVVTPPENHAPVAIASLAAGLPVLIEKPLAPTLDDARRIIAASEASGAIAMVSQNYRFKRAPRTVQRLIAEGVIGEVQQVFVNFQKAPHFEGFRVEMEEPLIVDGMAHQLDQIRGVVGLEPTVLRARSWNPSWSEFAGNASVALDVECAGGARVLYTGSWASRGETTSWDGDWDIQGERGAIAWRNNQITITFTSLFDTVFLAGALENAGVMQVSLDVLDVEERLGVLAEFRRAIVSGRSPETDVRDNIGSLQLILATLESARHDGDPVTLQSAAALLAG